MTASVPVWVALVSYLLGPTLWGGACGLFYGWCKRRAHRSLWCERRIVNEARRRHNTFVRILPEGYTLVIRGTTAGDLFVSSRKVEGDG